jgi:hypothetical protein
MEIEINVSEPIANMTQTQSQIIKRTANVMTEHGFHVIIKWKNTKELWMPPTVRNHPPRTTITQFVWGAYYE